MAGNSSTHIYYPVENFLNTIKQYDRFLDFSMDFFSNLKLKMNYRIQFENLMKSHLFDQKLMFVIEVLIDLSLISKEFRSCKIINYIICDQFYDSIVKHIFFLYKKRGEQDDSKPKDLALLVKLYDAVIFHLPMSEVTYQKMFTLFQLTSDCMKIFGRCDMRAYENLKDLLGLLVDLSNSPERNNFFYKNLSVYPTAVNLYEKYTLPKSVLIGPYKHSEEYLDIHFKLLRENFFQEIRDDLESIKKERLGIKVNKKYDIYRNVTSTRLCHAKCWKHKICHIIQFSSRDENYLKSLNWESSKKFMNGSLLFFSRNNFTTFVVGTVEKNFCVISEGKVIKIGVSIIGNPYQIAIGSSYDMLEPSSFFEPYFQSLTALKSINPYNFPLAEDLISVTRNIYPSPLTENRTAPLLCDDPDLNQSQREALKACLSQKFTLIQGPPGTGKSYLTRKLVNILANESDNRPVFVICARNRSLDIILEPLARSGLKVLRFGRTDNEFLEKYTFFEYKSRNWQMGKLKNKPPLKFMNKNISSCRKIINHPNQLNKPEAVEDVYKLHDTTGAAMRLHKSYHDGFQILRKKIQVIGATTTAAAKNNRMLSQIRPKAVIIEEAAEVLEATVTSSLPSSCDHLILIGDHMQLQPISRLPKEYNMHISLFERMIKNQKGYNKLTVQHRMRPEIAELICPLIYDDLINHESVHVYPNVDGVTKNLFFLSHQEEEVFQAALLSYINPHEGNLVLSFANYLVKQGYKANTISILAAYSAQYQYLIKESVKYKLLEGMDIQTIDNYQGGENNIVLLSLVRSKGETIGFLSKSNRVNVAISRAKVGLFMFGNIDTLVRCSQIWPKIQTILKKMKSIGNKMTLICKTHQQTTLVSMPVEINQLKLGGCSSKCGIKMECGHKCTMLCHPDLSLHTRELCKKPCLRSPCGFHACNKKCYEDCGLCNRNRSFTLKCGHQAILPCSSDPDEYICTQSCKRKPCGKHVCKKRCFEQCGTCKQKRSFALECGHAAVLECSSDASAYKCLAKCKRKSCEKHRCVKMCYEDCQPCEKELSYTLKCGHVITLKCTDNLKGYECSEPCERVLSCGEHLCPNKCHEKCEDICNGFFFKLLACGHSTLVVCSQPESSIKCLFNCEIMRSCGIHKCTKNCVGCCLEICQELIKVKLVCGHTITTLCSTNINRIRCQQVCKKKTCDLHYCKEICHYPKKCLPCMEKIVTFHNVCGHPKPVTVCWNKFELDPLCRRPVHVSYTKCSHTYTVECHSSAYERTKKFCPRCQDSMCILL